MNNEGSYGFIYKHTVTHARTHARRTHARMSHARTHARMSYARTHASTNEPRTLARMSHARTHAWATHARTHGVTPHARTHAWRTHARIGCRAVYITVYTAPKLHSAILAHRVHVFFLELNAINKDKHDEEKCKRIIDEGGMELVHCICDCVYNILQDNILLMKRKRKSWNHTDIVWESW